MTNANLTKITHKVEDIKLVMHDNIEKAAQNCVKIETIGQKSEDLMKEAGVFRNNARELKNKMWWKNVKMWVIVFGIISAIIIIIVCVVYSYNSSSKS